MGIAAPAEASGRRRITRKLADEVVHRYETCVESTRTIAAKLDIGKATVLGILKKEGVTIRPVGCRY